jgi:hypothetical protein
LLRVLLLRIGHLSPDSREARLLSLVGMGATLTKLPFLVDPAITRVRAGHRYWCTGVADAFLAMAPPATTGPKADLRHSGMLDSKRLRNG